VKALLVAVLLCGLALPCLAQEFPDRGLSFFVGPAYDNDEGFSMFVGTGKRVFNNLWLIGRTVVGEYQSLEPDVAYIIGVGDVKVGLIAGPNVDWLSNPQEDVTAYFVGAAGGLIGYKPSELGVYIAAKYKFALEPDNAYPNGWQAGLFLAASF